MQGETREEFRKRMEKLEEEGEEKQLRQTELISNISIVISTLSLIAYLIIFLLKK